MKKSTFSKDLTNYLKFVFAYLIPKEYGYTESKQVLFHELKVTSFKGGILTVIFSLFSFFATAQLTVALQDPINNIDNCTSGPVVGTYTQTGTLNGRPLYTGPGGKTISWNPNSYLAPGNVTIPANSWHLWEGGSSLYYINSNTATPTCATGSATWTGTFGCFVINVSGDSCTEPVVLPDNDECISAEPISCGDTVVGSTANATDSGNNPSPDVFYVLSGTAAGEIVTASLCGSSFDTLIRVFDACGGNQLFSNDDFCSLQSEVTFTSDGASDYYIMVEGFFSASGDYTLTVTCEQPAPAPVNDDCAGALTLECGVPIEGTTAGATASGLDGNCAGFTSDSALDLFYTFTADGASSYTIALGAAGNNALDGVLFVYSGTCEALTYVDCADANFPAPSGEEIILDTPAAGTYTVRLFNYEAEPADFTLNLTCTEPEVCSISNTNLVSTECDPLDTENLVLTVAFDVSNGSGNFELIDLSTNASIGSISGAPSTATGLEIIGTISKPTTAGQTLNVSVLDIGSDVFRATELAVNGDFETGDFSGWTQFPSADGAQTIVGANPSEGDFAANVLNTQLASASVLKNANLGIGLVNPGDVITISFDVRGSATLGGVAFAEFFSEIDGGGSSSAEILGGAPLSLNADENVWTNLSFTTLAGPDVSAGVTFQLAAVTSANQGSQSNIFIDNLSITIEGAPIECMGTPIEIELPFTEVTFTALANLTIDAGVQAGLSGGTPAGGVYSGPGITDDGNGQTYGFDPAAAGVGIHTLTYTFTDNNGCTNSASDDVEVLPSLVDLELEMNVDNATPNVGDAVTFIISVTNQGPGVATGVEITDQLPSGYSYLGFTTSQGSYNSGSGLWSVGNLVVGETETLTLTAIVNASGDFLNLAEVTAQNEEDLDSTPNNGVDTDGDGNVIDDPDDEDDGDGQIVENGICSITDISVSNISACNDPGILTGFPFDDTFSADVTVSFTSKPVIGSLILGGDGTGSIPVGDIGNVSYTFQNVIMSANGTPINLTVSFSEAPECTLNKNDLGTAPEPCSSTFCSIMAIEATNISDCNDQGTSDPSDDTFTADVTVGFTNIPTTGSLDLTEDGTASVQVTELTGSFYTFTSVVMSADGGNIFLTARFSNNANCNLTNSQVGLAPGPCSVSLPCDDDTEPPQITGLENLSLQCPGELSLTPLEINNSTNPIESNSNFGTAVFGQSLFSNPVSGDLILVDDGVSNPSLSNSSLNDACEPIINDISGKIAVIDRGACAFVTKVLNAQNAGAIAVIIVNNQPGDVILNMGGEDPFITIPTISVSNNYGNVLKAEMVLGNVNVTFPGLPFQITDNCEISAIDLNQNIIEGDCINNFTIENIYTVTDAAGNVTTETQTIIFNDETPPNLINDCPTPADFGFTDVLSQAELPSADDIEFAFLTLRDDQGFLLISQFYADNCGGLSDLNVLDPVISGDVCNGTATYAIEVFDACGNVNSECSFTINYGFGNTAPLVFDDMEHGDPFGNGWFAFGGIVGGGGLGVNQNDLPPVNGDVFSIETGWGSGGIPGFFGGFGRSNTVDISQSTTFNFWINPDAGQDYTLEINLQDDDDNDGNADDEFQYNLAVSPNGPGAISGGGWQLISIPLTDFFDDNSFLTGGNGTLDGTVLTIVVAVISNSGTDVTFRTDYWSFTNTTSFVWTGALNTDWENPGNWQNDNAPGLSVAGDVTIPMGMPNYPVFVIGQDMYIDPCSTLTVEVKASLTVNPNVVVTNDGTVVNDGTMIFESDVTGSAYIGSGSGIFIGDYTVERYIPAKRAYRQLASPVTTSTPISENWQQDTHITGPIGNTDGFDGTQTGNPSMYIFDNLLYEYVQMANTNATNLLPGVMYHTLIRGDRNTDLTNNEATPSVITLRATGALTAENEDGQTISVTVPEERFVAVGNPFQSQVDMNTVLTTRATNIAPNFYWVWDPTLGTRGAYVAIIAASGDTSSGDSEANQFLQAGQAGWVYTSGAGTSSVNFNQDSKYTGPETAVFRDASDLASSGQMRLSLYESNALANNQTATDGVLILFDTNGNNAVDAFDALDITNLDENFTTNNNGVLLSIENRATPLDGEEIQLEINTYRHTNYTIVAEGMAMQGPAAYLYDAYTNVSTQIPSNGTMTYNYTVDPSNEASVSGDRFKIVYSGIVLSVDGDEMTQLALYPNPTSIGKFYINVPAAMDDLEVSIHNVLGAILYKEGGFIGGQKATIITEQIISEGVYFVTMSSQGRTITKKLIIK